MGDHDAGDSHPFEDRYYLELHLGAQLLVQGPHGLVEQQQLGALGQRPRQGHPLALAAGELVGAAPGEALHVHELEHLGDPLLDLGPRQAILLETEGDVLGHRHVGEERVGLEHHVDGPLMGRHGGDVLAVEQDLPFAGLFEAGQDAQQGRLAGARTAQQGEDLPLADGQVDVVHGQHAVEALADAADLDQGITGSPARRAGSGLVRGHHPLLSHPPTAPRAVGSDGLSDRISRGSRPGYGYAARPGASPRPRRGCPSPPGRGRWRGPRGSRGRGTRWPRGWGWHRPRTR